VSVVRLPRVCHGLRTEEADPDNDPATRDLAMRRSGKKLLRFPGDQEMIPEWVGENGVDLSPSALAEAKEQKDRQRGHAVRTRWLGPPRKYARAVSQWLRKSFPANGIF